MKQTSRTARRLLAVPVVIATALSVGPAFTGIAQAAPPTGSFLNPSTTGPGNVISDKLDGTNGTYRFLVRATDPDTGGSISSVQIQIEDGDADATFETIGTATQVGSTDTYELQWDVSAYTPAIDVDNDPGFVRALVTDGNAETSFIGTATGQAVTFMDSTAETATITSPTNGGTLGFFPTSGAHTGLIAGTASAGATVVDGFFTTSAVGSTPSWSACGTDAAPAAATGGTKTFSINCDIGTGTVASTVTAVAVRVNTTESGDAVRVTGYGQTLQSFTITPTSDNQTIGFCNTYAVAIVDQNSRAIAGAPVQVQVKGTNAGANASSTDPDLQDVIKFAQNAATEGTSSDPFGPAGGTTEPSNQCDVAAEPDNAPDDVDGSAGPNESVLAGAAADDIAATKAITGTTAGNGQFKFSLALLSSDTAAVGTYNVSAFLDSDGDNTQDTGEVGNTATKTYQAATATTLTATPASATNVVGESHTVTGMLVDQNGNPMSGQTLTFRVTSGPHANSDLDSAPGTPNGIFGQGATGADGKVSKSYTGTAAGTDTIVVFQDANSNLTPDSGEKQATVSKTWVSTTAASCIDLDPNSAINPTTSAHQIRAYVTDGTYDASGDDDKTDAGAARENDCAGNPLAGVPVDFTISSGSAGTLSPNSNGSATTERVFTDANGMAVVTLNKTDATTSGVNTVDATVPGGASASTYSAKVIPLNYEDISGTGTIISDITNDDDTNSSPITMPFPFTYYGVSDNTVTVSSNGFVNFDQTNTDDACCSGDAFPDSGSPNGGLVGGFFTDLDPGEGGDVYMQTLGSAPNRRFIVQYKAVQNNDSAVDVSDFEIKFFEGTNRIEVHYLNAENDASSGLVSAGIENQAGTIGTEFLAPTLKATLSNTAVQYTPGQTSVTKQWEVAGKASDIDCTPASARNVTGQSHTVSCKVTDFFGSPVSGQQVSLRVIYGPHADNDLDSNPLTTAGFFGTGTTNGAGTFSASYTGSDVLPNNGLDVIDGFLDVNNDQVDNGDSTQTSDANGNGIVDAGDQSDSGELSSFVNKGWSTSSQVSTANVELDMQPSNNSGNDTPSGTSNTASCDADLFAGFGGASWNSTTTGTIGFTEIVCVSSKDVNGNILIGQAVTLTSSGVGQVTDAKGANGTASKTANIGSNGYAVFYIVSNQTGTQNLVASGAGSSDTDAGSKTWGSLDARRVAIANLGGTTATPGSTHAVKITVTDSQGNPVPGAGLAVTESGPGRFVAGPSTEPSTIFVTTGSDGTVTVELQSLSSESGTETITAALTGLNAGPNNDECERAANDPTGAPAGVCSASTSFTWTTGSSLTFKILSPSAYYTTVAGGTFANFSGVGGQPGEVLTVHRKIGNGSYTTMAGPTVGSDGTWTYSLKVTTTTAVYFTGVNGTTAVKVIRTTLNITFPSTYYYTVASGQRTAIYGSGARPGDVLEIWTKAGNQTDFVRRTNTVTATSYGTWALRFNVYTPMAIYFRGVNGKSDAVVYRVS